MKKKRTIKERKRLGSYTTAGILALTWILVIVTTGLYGALISAFAICGAYMFGYTEAQKIY